MKIYLKKICCGMLILCLLFSISFNAFPKKVNAVDAVYDPINFVQNVLSYITEFVGTASTVASEALDYSDNYKEYVLDPIVTALMRSLIQTMTKSIVEWIDSGFDGSPAFLQDPSAFFLDMADQATGEFISESGPLSQLCSPFSIDIRLALSFKYHPKIQKRYACTLNTIIGNVKNAAKNSSINGFTAGDFSQGGWPAFVSLTTEPQNNIYGAYLQADSELSFKVLSAQQQKKDELNQGNGFLSYTTCKDVVVDTNSSNAYSSEDPGNEASSHTVKKCSTQTPGSVISGALNNQLGSETRQMELADELGESVTLILNGLVNQVLKQGLAAVSQKDASGSSYLNKVSTELQNGGKNLATIKKNILNGIDGYISRSQTYKDNYDMALKVVTDIKDIYTSAQTCYTTKIASSTPALTASQTAYAQAKIGEIQSAIGLNIAPIAVPLQAKDDDANHRLTTLIDIKEAASTAKTIQEIDKPAQDYGDLAQSMSLTNPQDIADSQGAITKAHKDADPLKPAADARVLECQSFPLGIQ